MYYVLYFLQESQQKRMLRKSKENAFTALYHSDGNHRHVNGRERLEPSCSRVSWAASHFSFTAHECKSIYSRGLPEQLD